MKKFTLISPCLYGSGLPLPGVSSKQGTTLSPPIINGFLHIVTTNRLNELRQCAAIEVSTSVHHQLVVVMEYS